MKPPYPSSRCDCFWALSSFTKSKKKFILVNFANGKIPKYIFTKIITTKFKCIKNKFVKNFITIEASAFYVQSINQMWLWSYAKTVHLIECRNAETSRHTIFVVCVCSALRDRLQCADS